MLTLKRRAYSYTTDVYALDFDQELVDKFNEMVQGNLPEGDTFEPLNVTDLYEIYTNDDHPRYDETVRYWLSDGRIGKSSLGKEVYDFVSDEVWNVEPYRTQDEIEDWSDDFFGKL